MKNTSSKYLTRGLVIVAAAFVIYHIGVTSSLDGFFSMLRFCLPILLAIWLAALVSLLSRRDIDVHDKITWVVVVLLLNGIGGILYFRYAPKRQLTAEELKHTVPSDAQAFGREGISWNPILGENRFPPHEGLNPQEEPRE